MKRLHLRSVLGRLTRCTENCSACSWRWSAEWAEFFSMTVPNHPLHSQCFRSWTNWATEFSPIHHIHLNSCQRLPLLQASQELCRENASTTSRMHKILSKSSSNPKAWIFNATGVNKFLIDKNVLVVMTPVLINKNVFKHSYNDLKLWSKTTVTFSPT